MLSSYLLLIRFFLCISASQLWHLGNPSWPWKHSVDSSMVVSKTQLFDSSPQSVVYREQSCHLLSILQAGSGSHQLHQMIQLHTTLCCKIHIVTIYRSKPHVNSHADLQRKFLIAVASIILSTEINVLFNDTLHDNKLAMNYCCVNLIVC